MTVWPWRAVAISSSSWRRARPFSVFSIFLKRLFTSLCCFLSRSVAFIYAPPHRVDSKIVACGGRGIRRERWPGRRSFRERRRPHRSAEAYQGQVAPPLLSAAVLSPLPQSTNVPVALLEYL